MSIKAPCLNCINRHIDCHSTCEKYISYKIEHNKDIECKNKIKCQYNELYEFHIQKLKKLHKR